MTAETKYWAFLSYSTKDDKIASRIFRRLESFVIPAKFREPDLASLGNSRLRPIFRDREELASSGDLGATLRSRLQESKCLIVVCSPAAAKSKWVNQEIIDFKRMGRGHQILAAIVDGEPHSQDSTRECFAPALRYKIDSDGRVTSEPEGYEPIAADFRAGRDGETNGLIKLAAGLIGVGFDALKRRHESDRRRRVAISAVLVVASVSIGLAGLRYAIDPMVRAEVSVATERTRTAVQREEAGLRASIEIEDLAGRAVEAAIADSTTDSFWYHTNRGAQILREGLRNVTYTEAQVPIAAREFFRMRGRVRPTRIVGATQNLAREFANAIGATEAEATVLLREHAAPSFQAPRGINATSAGVRVTSPGGIEINCERQSYHTITSIRPRGGNTRTHQFPSNYCGLVFWSPTEKYVAMMGFQSLLVFSGETGELIQRIPLCGDTFASAGDWSNCAQDTDGLVRGRMLAPDLSDFVGVFFDERGRRVTFVRPDPRSSISDRTGCDLPRLVQFDLGAIEDMSFEEQLRRDEEWRASGNANDPRDRLSRMPWYEWPPEGPRPWCSSISG